MRLKTHLMALFFFFAIAISNAQTPLQDEKPYIEVTGTAEMEIVPDQIYLKVVLKEKIENKQKVTIDEQESKLKESLKSAGIDITNLSVSDANADYVRIKFRTRDVLTIKEYVLLVSNAEKMSKSFEVFEKLQVYDANVLKVSHSRMDSLKKEVKIMAIKAAKDKADYLLTAIGEKTGQALEVKETSSYQGNAIRGHRANEESNVYLYANGKAEKEMYEEEYQLQFQKIKIESAIYVKFLIK